MLWGFAVLSGGLAFGQEAGGEDAAAVYERYRREALAKVDASWNDYAPKEKLAGRINTRGVDELNNIVTLLGEAFLKHHPGVRFEVEGKGGSTAPPMLYADAVSFGTMTRPYLERELTPFLEKFGYGPTYFTVTYDVLAVWVHEDNPIWSLTLAQLDAIFSETRKLGHGEAITKWGQLGLGGEWAERPITAHGRNAASGSYGFFMRSALGGGRMKEGYVEHPGSTKMVEAIASDRGAIGFTGIGYRSEGIRAVPLEKEAGQGGIPPELGPAMRGEYPLARPLLLVLNHKPGAELDPLRAEFLRLVYSKQGQAVVALDGYPPLPPAFGREQLRQMGLGEEKNR